MYAVKMKAESSNGISQQSQSNREWHYMVMVTGNTYIGKPWCCFSPGVWNSLIFTRCVSRWDTWPEVCKHHRPTSRILNAFCHNLVLLVK